MRSPIRSNDRNDPQPLVAVPDPPNHQPCDSFDPWHMCGSNLYLWQCAPGVLGANDFVESQDGPDCSGFCTAGYYCPQGSSMATICPIGSFCVTGSPAPTPCVASPWTRDCPDDHSTEKPNKCISSFLHARSCPPGTYGAGLGLVSSQQCIACPAGSWCFSGLRISCQPNFYNPTAGATGLAACLQCPEHSVTAAEAAQTVNECVCRAGFVSIIRNSTRVCECGAGFGLVIEAGTSRCELCGLGSYKVSAGNEQCRSCSAASTTTVSLGTIRHEDCVCSPSFYSAPDTNGTLRCFACALAEEDDGGTNCTSAGVVLSSLPVSAGSYRQHSASRYVRSCAHRRPGPAHPSR